MKKSHLHWHPKFCANKVSDHNDDRHSDDDYNFSDMSTSSSFSFDSNKKHILEKVYDEITGTASLFQQETNINHLDGKHNIGLKADSPTVVSTPSQPPPTVSAASSRLTHSIAHVDLVQDKVIFFSVNLEYGGKILESYSYLLLQVTSQEVSLENSINMSSH